MILYHLPLSTYSLKARLALALKGVTLDLREPPGGSYRSDAYRELVPPATIPALVDGDFVLTESDAIIEYLDEMHDGPPLLPQDARGRAHARMVSRLADLRLEASLRALFPAIKAGRRLTALNLEPAERAWSLLCDMADKAAPWACGERPSLADCSVIAAMQWFDLMRGDGAAPEPPRAQVWRAAWDSDDRLRPLLSAYRTLAQGWLTAAGYERPTPTCG